MGIEARFRAVEQRIAVANGLDVQERWVDIASPPVKVRLLESGVGDPVLFIHGIAAPGIGMAALAGRLPGHRLLLIDLPGHGLSPPYLWQGAPVREQAVNVIAGVLDGLGIDQVTLVGNALGGLFSLWFALDRPKRVARAVIVGQPAVAIAGSRADPLMGLIAWYDDPDQCATPIGSYGAFARLRVDHCGGSHVDTELIAFGVGHAAPRNSGARDLVSRSGLGPTSAE